MYTRGPGHRGVFARARERKELARGGEGGEIGRRKERLKQRSVERASGVNLRVGEATMETRGGNRLNFNPFFEPTILS